MNVQDIDWNTFDFAALSADEREALKRSAIRRAHAERAESFAAVPRLLRAWRLRLRASAPLSAAAGSRAA